MPQIDAASVRCVISLVSPTSGDETLQTTSLAALVAVTILHDAETCPEQRLIEILEQSGEVEVLDSEEADDFGLEELDTPTGYQPCPRIPNWSPVFKRLMNRAFNRAQ